MTNEQKIEKFRSYREQLIGEIELRARELPDIVAKVRVSSTSTIYDIERYGNEIAEKAVRISLIEWVICLLEENEK